MKIAGTNYYLLCVAALNSEFTTTFSPGWSSFPQYPLYPSFLGVAANATSVGAPGLYGSCLGV